MENRLRDALRHDRARVQIGKISRFGLLELSRQRLQPSLEETTHSPCPRCHGTGHIRDTESSALHILRILQEEAMKENTAAIHAQVPVDVATYLLNEKRSEIFGIEARLKVNVVLIPNPNLATPNYNVERLRHDAPQLDEQKPSYEMVTVRRHRRRLVGRDALHQRLGTRRAAAAGCASATADRLLVGHGHHLVARLLLVQLRARRGAGARRCSSASRGAGSGSAARSP